MNALAHNPTRIVIEAGTKVLRRPAYLLLAGTIAVVALAAALWLPNYRLLGAVLATPGVTFGTVLRLAASLLGGLASNYGVVAAVSLVTAPVLFGVDIAMIAYFMRLPRAPRARRTRREHQRRGERRDRGRLRGLRLVSAAADPLLYRGGRGACAVAARRRGAGPAEHCSALALDLSRRPQDSGAAALRAAAGRAGPVRRARIAYDVHRSVASRR